MSWMTEWASPYSRSSSQGASGARVNDVDGHVYVDFCLGDTGAMAGHAPPATVAAIERQAARGITTMLPTEDAVGSAPSCAPLRPAVWQFALSATDANRFALRLAAARDRPTEDPGLQPLLSRHRRRDPSPSLDGGRRRSRRATADRRSTRR